MALLYLFFSKIANLIVLYQAAKAKRRQEVFPKDCQKAFEMGVRFASKSR